MCTFVVTDSSAFIYGKYLDGVVITVPGVVRELKDIRSRMRLQISGARIERPSKKMLTKARQAAQETGDTAALSEVDLELLAKALEMKAVLATDDYALQNVALYMGLKVEPVAHPKIKKIIKRTQRCVGCRRPFQGDVCPVCGTPARKKKGR
ncbi:MAG: NOB1 family endonuclease [Methanotrichaceae archaeon]